MSRSVEEVHGLWHDRYYGAWAKRRASVSAQDYAWTVVAHRLGQRKSLSWGSCVGDCRHDRANRKQVRDEVDAIIAEIMAAVQGCTARLWHGPGHQSSTPCELPSGHDGPHRCIYGSMRQEAHWRTGDYTGRLRAQGIEFKPESYPEDMGMTGYFDEPPEEDET